MPVVPAAGYQTGPDVPPPIEPAPFGQPQDFLRIDARPEAFGAAVGTALTRAGGELEKGAGELAQAAISRQEFFNAVAADNASTEYMKESHKIFYGDPDAGVDPVTGQANKPGFFALKGQDAINAGSPNDQLDALQQRIAASLPNDRARLQFNSETRKLRTYTDGEISRHWDEQLKIAGDATLAAKGDLHERDAATYFNDPVRFAQILEDGRNDITKRAQGQKGMNADPAVLADARAQEDAKLYGSAVRAAVAAGNLDRAEQLKNEAIARGIWTGEQAHQAEQLIEPKRNQQVGKELGRGAFSGGGGGGAAGPGAADAAQRIATTLRNRGYSEAAITGALNNALTESSLNPASTGAAGERGYFQFHPASHIGPFTTAYKGDWSPEAQANYIADVLDKDMPDYKKTTDAAAATRQFMTGFEKPADQSEAAIAGRIANTATSTRLLAGGGKAGAGAPPAQGGTPIAIGDSIAHGFQKSGGAGGTGKDLDAADTTVHAAGGRSPSTILSYLKKQPDGSLNGQPVIFSTGVSNGPAEANLVPQQLAELKRMGAGPISVVGVGTKAGEEGGKHYDLNQYNAQIEQAAKAAGATFLGGLPAVVHPDRSYYSGAMPKAASAAPAGKPQTVPEGDIIHNPKTGEYLQNVGGKLVTYLPPGV